MATMDIIQLHGGKPANFLDVGGAAGEDQARTRTHTPRPPRRVRSRSRVALPPPKLSF
jgi:hypothetical protein